MRRLVYNESSIHSQMTRTPFMCELILIFVIDSSRPLA